MEGKGRVMVTTRDVQAGETIFMEEPVVHGPNQGILIPLLPFFDLVINCIN